MSEVRGAEAAAPEPPGGGPAAAARGDEEQPSMMGETWMRAADIAHIVQWEPKVVEETNVTPESAAEELARFRMRAGGDMSTDYRDGYRSWRLGRSVGATENSGGAVGCHPSARREATMDRADPETSAYPRLAPAERNTPRYWWRYTVSYWVATSFMIGSVLFVTGAAFDYFVTHPNPVRQSATINWPYFIGGGFFIGGSYLGYFAAINLGRREDAPPRYTVWAGARAFRKCCRFMRVWRIKRGTTTDATALLPPGDASFASTETSSALSGSADVGERRDAFLPDVEPEAWHSYWGYLAYMVGALWFQVGILVDILEARNLITHHSDDDDSGDGSGPTTRADVFGDGRSRSQQLAAQSCLTAVPATLGGFLFVVGSLFAVDVNESWRLSLASTDVAWWVSNFNCVGSFLFLEAGLFSFTGLQKATGFSDALTVKLPYLVGSLGFLFASSLELFMWRVELHGLSFVRAINKTTKIADLVQQLVSSSSLGENITPLAESQDVSGVSLNQLGFVLVVVFTFAFSLMDLVFAARLSPCHGTPFWASAYDIYDSALQALLCFAALALASVVHTVPRQRPFGMLLWILRFAMLLLLGRYAWKFANSWHAASHPCGGDPGPRHLVV